MYFLLLVLAFSTQFFVVSCTPTGLLEIIEVLVMDAPVDDPLYADVFVTIDEIKLGGKSIDGFERQTINLSRLQNGLSETLFEEEIAVGSYDKISLVLDFDKDASGATPGCYINTSYGRKVDLANLRTGKQEIELLSNFEIKQDEEPQFVIDFDLRKTIRSSQPGDESEMSFIDIDDIGKSLRVIETNKSGDLQVGLQLGEDIPGDATFYLVYVYPKGGFDQFTEYFDGDGDGITYENAVCSGKLAFESVNGTASLLLPYIPEGEYELLIEAYERYEFSQTRLGYLVMEGKENIRTPFSIKKGEKTSLNLNGGSIVQ